MPDFSLLEQKLGILFSNKDLLKEALTHRSYLNENPKWRVSHNERLEFLGDAVLELIVTENLFKRFPRYSEGDLTSIRAALVNYQKLADVARSIDLENFILLSRGEAKDRGRAREVILANAIEALIGAVYIDLGYKVTADLVSRFIIEPHLLSIMQNHAYKDPKSLLQEIIQEKFKLTPSYKVLEEYGPDHKKVFKMGVYFGEKYVACGQGYSKQEAEIEAAKNALSQLKLNKNVF